MKNRNTHHEIGGGGVNPVVLVVGDVKHLVDDVIVVDGGIPLEGGIFDKVLLGKDVLFQLGLLLRHVLVDGRQSLLL